MHILKNYLNKRLVPLILIHPEDIFVKGVLKKFEYVLSHGKCITIQSFIEVLEKCLREVKERINNSCSNIRLLRYIINLLGLITAELNIS